MSQSLLLRLSIGLTAAALIMAALIWRHYSQDVQIVDPSQLTPVHISPTSTRPGGGERARLRVMRADSSANRGGEWNVDVQTNAWARCMVDVYDPEDKSQTFASPKEAEALSVSGQPYVRWTWHVPADAKIGNWRIRLLCGTYDNLAIDDVTVKVK